MGWRIELSPKSRRGNREQLTGSVAASQSTFRCQAGRSLLSIQGVDDPTNPVTELKVQTEELRV